MAKNIDLKNRTVDLYDVDTGTIENEIVSYLQRNMDVRIYSASFTNKKYVFTGTPNKNKAPNAITISGYRDKKPGEHISVEIQ